MLMTPYQKYLKICDQLDSILPHPIIRNLKFYRTYEDKYKYFYSECNGTKDIEIPNDLATVYIAYAEYYLLKLQNHIRYSKNTPPQPSVEPQSGTMTKGG